MDEDDRPVGVQLQEEPRRRRPLLLATIVVAVLVLVAWASVWWGRTPDVLEGGYGVRLEPRADLDPMLVGVTSPATRPGEENVSLVDVEAVMGRNDAEADVTFVVCRPKGSSAVAGVRGSVERTCAGSRAAHDTTLRVAGEYILMVVTPQQRGVAQVEAVEVTYRNGWQVAFLPRTVTVEVSARMKVE